MWLYYFGSTPNILFQKMALKEKFNKGYECRTFNKITNMKGKSMFIQESMSFKDVEKLQLKIMLDVKKAVSQTTREINDCFTGLTKDDDFERGLSTALELIKLNFGDFEKMKEEND